MTFSREQDKADDLVRAIFESMKLWSELDLDGGHRGSGDPLMERYLLSLDKVAEAFSGMQWALEK